MTRMHLAWQRVAEPLRSVGYPVVMAGGAVRDILMDRTPKDIDIFLLGYGVSDANALSVLGAMGAFPPVEVQEFHKSEPFLQGTWMVDGVAVQVMASPHTSVDALLDSFDWNVSRFAYDGAAVTAREDIANIGVGKALKLHRVTYPLSTLRRWFRFSERFGMVLPLETIKALCMEVAK